MKWPWRRSGDCGGKCCYRCKHYELFNEGYKVASAQADEAKRELRELRMAVGDRIEGCPNGSMDPEHQCGCRGDD